MIQNSFKFLLIYCFAIASENKLIEGFYLDVNSKDSISLKKDEDNYTLEFNNGNVILFTSQNETIDSKNSECLAFK